MTAAPDALSVVCPYCAACGGFRCLVAETGCWARRPHVKRARLALAVAAHADPALDEWPQLGPVTACGICGVPGMNQRHRVVDAIADAMAAGESAEEVAEDYGLPLAAALAVAAWAERWPGATG